MLELTVQALHDEFEAAHAKTLRVLSGYERQLKQRAGEGYTGETPEYAARQNYAHRWLSYVVPQLVGRDINARIGSVMHPEASEDLELELNANAWIVDSRLREFSARGPANDMQYNFGVVLMAPDPIPGATPIEGVGSDWAPGDPKRGPPAKRQPWAPKFTRVPQKRYFEDALSPDRDGIRLQGHIGVRDKNDILREGEKGGWNVKVIEEYAADAQLEALGRPDHWLSGREVKRNEIVYAEIWYPEYDLKEGNPWGVPASPGPDKGFHGTIFTILVNRATIAASGKLDDRGNVMKIEGAKRKDPEDFPRKPRPFYGPPRGPYVVFGQFTVPENSLPLGALSACESEMRELNTDMDVAQRMMRSFKRLGITGRGNEEKLKVIQDGQHDWLYLIPGMTKEDFFQMEIGGLDQQALAHLEFSLSNLESTLGLSEMHSGKVSGVGTATEQTYAENAAQARFAGVKMAFDDGMADIIWRACWWMWHDNRFAKYLKPNGVAELVKRGMAEMQEVELPDGRMEERLPEALSLGGDREGVPRIPWSALSIDVDLVERANTERRQAEAMNQLSVVQMLVQGAQAVPGFPWWKVAEKVGPAINFPGLAEMFGKPDEIAASAVKVQQALAMAAGGGGGGQAQRGSPKMAQRGNAPPRPSAGGGGGKPERTAQKRGPAGARPGASSKKGAVA